MDGGIIKIWFDLLFQAMRTKPSCWSSEWSSHCYVWLIMKTELSSDSRAWRLESWLRLVGIKLDWRDVGCRWYLYSHLYCACESLVILNCHHASVVENCEFFFHAIHWFTPIVRWHCEWPTGHCEIISLRNLDGSLAKVLYGEQECYKRKKLALVERAAWLA